MCYCSVLVALAVVGTDTVGVLAAYIVSGLPLLLNAVLVHLPILSVSTAAVHPTRSLMITCPVLPGL